MPIYEFHSPDTGKIYSFYAPSFSFSELVPKCPDGTNNKMVKLLSLGDKRKMVKAPDPPETL